MAEKQFNKIEKILDRRKVNENIEYKIKWEGHPLNDSVWATSDKLKNLENALPLIEEYNKKNPIKEDNQNFSKKKTDEEEINNENKNNDETSKNKNNSIEEYSNENSKILIYENEDSYKVDDSFLQVLKISINNGQLMAVVEKMGKNGEKYKESISTQELRSVNPWILLDFYESKIKFT